MARVTTSYHGRKRPRIKSIRWNVIIPATLAALIIPFAVGYALTVYVMFPAPEPTGTGIAVPDLAGRTVSEAEGMLRQAGLGEVTVEMELPHPDVASGQILAQDPLAGQQLLAGAGVRVSVSTGRAAILVPDVDGLDADAAEQQLRQQGFTTNRVDEPSSLGAGKVIRTSPQVGTRQRLPATVTIFVSTGPMPVDTFGVPFDTMSAIFTDPERGKIQRD